MDEKVFKNLKSTIIKTINNGIAFTHMNELEREDKEQEIVNFLKTKGYEVYIDECMIWALDENWNKVMMMELTRNTLYFTPFKAETAPVLVFHVLQFISKDYLMTLTSKIKKVKETEQEEIEGDSEEDTEEEAKPPPNFDFL
jgi:hypothetical protein